MRNHHRPVVILAICCLTLAIVTIAAAQKSEPVAGKAVLLSLGNGQPFYEQTRPELSRPASASAAPLSLIFDDGYSESGLGWLYGASAVQFLWFNRFSPASASYPFVLNSVHIQWIGEGSGSSVGDAISVYVWEDPDRNPGNGANIRGLISGNVQYTSGPFSTYTFNQPLLFCEPADVLIGTVDRSVNSYNSPPKWPARYDDSWLGGSRSWLAAYSSDPNSEGNPGHPPTLPAPAAFSVISEGVWMIRGAGETVDPAACGGEQMHTNFPDGAPGSYFTITGEGFPSTEDLTIEANHQLLGQITTDEAGEFSFIVATDEADLGTYDLIASWTLFSATAVADTAAARIRLDASVPIRPQEGSGPIFTLPAGIAYTELSFTPLIVR